MLFATIISLPISESEKTFKFLDNQKFWQKIKSKNINQGLDLQGGSKLIYKAIFSEKEDDKTSKLDAIRSKIETRVNRFGFAETSVYTVGTEKIAVELPGIDDPDSAMQEIGRTGEFKVYKYTQGKELIDLEITGEDLKRIDPQTIQNQDGSVENIISFEFKGQAVQKFANATQELVGTSGTIIIMLDDQILFNGTVSSAILDGKGQMSGFKSKSDSVLTANTIEDGALPVPLTLEATSQISAKLGSSAVGLSIIAGGISVTIIVLLLLWMYRGMGLIGIFDIFSYLVITISLYKILGVTLTISGIAGYLLSIGMEVDTNVLFFSRVKEELRRGKSVKLSIKDGFGSAWEAIKDSNISAIILGTILYYFGTTQVKGFASTLVLGILTSMFTSIFQSKILAEFLSEFKFFQKKSLFGIKESEISETNEKAEKMISEEKGKVFDIMKFSKFFVIFSLSFTILTIGLLIFPAKNGEKIGSYQTGLPLGIEFKGGTEILVENLDEKSLKKILNDAKVESLDVTKSSNGILAKFEDISSEEKTSISEIIKNNGGKIVSWESIGGNLSKEIVQNSLVTIGISSLFIVVYLAFSFRKVPKPTTPWQFGIATIVALLHDLVALFGFYLILTRFFDIKFDSLFITAFLTIAGFSTSDTIVVFDRIREKLISKESFANFKDLLNEAISNILARSLLTGISSQIVLLTLFLFGVSETAFFSLTMFAGIIFGSYSSIFIATAVLWKLQKNK